MFWNTLQLFWSEDRIQKWWNALFPDPSNPTKPVETCCNVICLSPEAHAYWTKSYFALQPIELSDDKKRLDVKFHWMPRRKCSQVDLLTPPLSFEGLEGGSHIGLFNLPSRREIYSGDRISITTDDPKTRPLPDYGLLEMQWILHRVSAMSGAAEIYDDFDDDAMVICNEWDPYGEAEWDSYKEDEWDSYAEDGNGNSYEESPP